ncbi:hypothetical protein FLONG3_6810 [Fusarium longipes]|uniref:Uncharacterized protein n=1 Tax=Fusarium longipes TaxID=694270 RepID=A0A395SIY7_9HYPO|nr:hypothetical protein FLONG3_6810 [Fusarium longipes]
MDLLSGVGGCCSSTERVESMTRRSSSISLEDGAYKGHTSEPVKSLLSSFDLRMFEEQRGSSPEYGCTLPAPSLASSPSVVAPMEVYLRCEESHKTRMMRVSETKSQQDKSTSEPVATSPAETCSWEFIDNPTHSRDIPNIPSLQRALSPKSAIFKPLRPAGNGEELSDSDISELAISVDSKPLSDNTEAYKEAVAEYKAASKRYKFVSPALPVSLY